MRQKQLQTTQKEKSGLKILNEAVRSLARSLVRSSVRSFLFPVIFFNFLVIPLLFMHSSSCHIFSPF